MHIVALKAPDSRDHRSVIHPDTVLKIAALKGITFSFELGIGCGINVSDQTFIDLGLKAISRDDCLSQGNLIITPSFLTMDESNQVQSGSTVLGMLNPFYAGDELKALNLSINPLTTAIAFCAIGSKCSPKETAASVNSPFVILT